MNRYPMFNPQLLLSFVAVCDSNSFTRAAERVFLSQSTVSQQVRRLEEMLGKPLFERSSHQVLLTEEGVKLLSYARRIIALNEEAHDALTGIWRDGVLRIGMPEDFAVPTTELLADFSREPAAAGHDCAPAPAAAARPRPGQRSSTPAANRWPAAASRAACNTAAATQSGWYNRR